MVIYGTSQHYPGVFSLEVLRKHTCQKALTACVRAGTMVHSTSGHTICRDCNLITISSGLRKCEGCNREYINTEQHEPTFYEPNCPDCE